VREAKAQGASAVIHGGDLIGAHTGKRSCGRRRTSIPSTPDDDGDGLLEAGDTIGGCHKFLSGSFAEGRIAAKATRTAPGQRAGISGSREADIPAAGDYRVGRNEIVAGTALFRHPVPLRPQYRQDGAQ
jgi:hypothetical protein